MLAQHGGNIVVGFAGMNDGRLSGLGCQQELSLEDGPLGRSRGMIVVVIRPISPAATTRGSRRR